MKKLAVVLILVGIVVLVARSRRPGGPPSGGQVIDSELKDLDGKPVRIFFMLLSRKDVAGLHIRMLAKIARFLRHDKFKKELLAADSTDKILEIFSQEEASHFSK